GSTQPPFSSQVTSSTVFAHRSGLPVSAFRIRSVVYSPHSTGAGGCSLCATGPQIQETCGSSPLAQSASKRDGKSFENAPAASSGSEWNCSKTEQGVAPTGPVLSELAE